jgi:hypothetical protein
MFITVFALRGVDGDIWIWSVGRGMVIYGYGVLGGDGDIWIWSAKWGLEYKLY